MRLKIAVSVVRLRPWAPFPSRSQAPLRRQQPVRLLQPRAIPASPVTVPASRLLHVARLHLRPQARHPVAVQLPPLDQRDDSRRPPVPDRIHVQGKVAVLRAGEAIPLHLTGAERHADQPAARGRDGVYAQGMADADAGRREHDKTVAETCRHEGAKETRSQGSRPVPKSRMLTPRLQNLQFQYLRQCLSLNVGS